MAVITGTGSNFNALAAGSGVSISTAAGTATISTTASSALLPLVVNSSGTGTLAVNTRYLCTNSFGSSFTLPSTSSVGDLIQIYIAPGVLNGTNINNVGVSGNFIYFLGNISGNGGAGGLRIQNNFSNGGCVFVELMCTTANTTWMVSNCLLGQNGIQVIS